MSSLAVFMVLGGATAVAATKIGANEIKANSIKTGKIVKEAVTAGKIKKAAVTEGKLANGAVTANKLADNAVTTPKIAGLAVTTDKIANDAVTGEKIKESTLGEVPSAANALNLGGKPASSFGPLGFAHILSNGTVEDPASGIASANVTKGGSGVYCFNNLGFTPRSITVTVDASEVDDDETGQGSVAPVDNDQCPGAEQASVSIFDPGETQQEDQPFYVVFP